MMYQRLEDALSSLIGGQKPIKGTLGYTIDGTYRVMVIEDAAQYYVRFADGSFAQVYHRGRVSPVPDLPVEVGFDSAGNMVIVGGDPERAGLFDGSHEVGPHSHARGSGMEFDIDPRLLTPVKAAPLAGLTVEVAQGAYRYLGALRWWSGGTITLTPPGSAHTWAWVAIGLDPETVTLVSASGSAVVVSAPLEPSIIPAIALTGAIPLAAVRVHNGQTELDEADFEDLRYALADIPAGIPGDVPAALDDLSDVETSGVSDGDVLTYASGTWIAQEPAVAPDGDSSGSVEIYAPVLLYDKTLGSAAVFDTSTTDDFGRSGIPTGYDHLTFKLVGRGAVSAAAVNGFIDLNNDTTASNYDLSDIHNTSADATGIATANSNQSWQINADSALANSWSILEGDIPFYDDDTRHKRIFVTSGGRNSGSDFRIYLRHMWWKNTAAVNRLGFRVDNATNTFKAGSRLQIWGWKRQIVGGTAYSTANVSSPPSDAELDSAFGEPSDVGAGFMGIVNDNGGGTDEYVCWSDGTNWFYAAGTKAV